jgi:two-component system, NtrC family, sensor kinase
MVLNNATTSRPNNTWRRAHFDPQIANPFREISTGKWHRPPINYVLEYPQHRWYIYYVRLAREGPHSTIHSTPLRLLRQSDGVFCCRSEIQMQPDKLFKRYQELQQYVGWTEDDAQRVHRLAPIVCEHFGPLIEDFYVAIQQNSTTMKVITGGAAQIARLKGTLLQWIDELFSGKYDEAYVLRRWKVGLKHVEIGLDQVYTNTALSRLRNGLLKLLERDASCHEPDLAARRSLNKLLDLDLAIIEYSYQTERERRQQRIERLATIGQVAGGIAHELRNPLNVIKTSAYYLRNAKNLSPSKTATHLERIDRQATMADGVIGALNSFARLPVPEMQSLDLSICIQEMLDLNVLPQTIQLTIELPQSVPKVLGDPRQLAIVFTNLVQNARDAMPDGGMLTIRSRQDGAFVEIDIADSGVGILQEDLGKIMEPLFSTKARGIGLGLPISRAIVEKHQGQLKVASDPGRGTTFTVRLVASTE